MEAFFQNVLTASFQGSIVILAVLILRLVLRKAPRKSICFLWTMAGLRLLMPVPLQSRFSLQPPGISLPVSFSLPGTAAFVWVGVAVIIASYSALSYIHLRRRVADAVKVPGGWESDRIETAFVLGFVKPQIYIPTGMSEETKKQILAHERTHLDKGDHWIKVIGFAALALHWFNPLVWLAYVLLCKDIEMACDERVVQFMELEERKAYATALLQCSTDHVHYAACPVAFGEVGVKHRIKSALNYKKPGFWISLLGAAAIAFVAVCLLTSPPEKVEVVVDNQEKLQESSHQDPGAYTPARLPETEPNPDWGIRFFMDASAPTGGTVVYAVEERFAAASEGMTVSDTGLERWTGTDWESVGPIQFDLQSIGFAQNRDRLVEYYEQTVDWQLRYGSLDPGDYRVRQTISGDTDSAAFCAPFHIYREALPTEEEAALSRCAAALEQLKGNEYAVILSETNRNGGLSPVKGIVKSSGKVRVDYYMGAFVTSSVTGDTAVFEAGKWDAPFRLNQNRRFLFPEGQSVISQEKIRFCSVWREYDGTACRGTDCYCFDENGKLQSVERLTERLDDTGGVTESHRIRMETQPHPWGGLSDGVNGYEPEDAFTAQEKSPWGIFFRVDDDLLKPGGSEVWLASNAVGVSRYTADGGYWLEKRVDSHWERLGGEEKEASWGSETITLGSCTEVRSVDWKEAYGYLDAGVYRMGKRFYNGTESSIQYAEFVMNPTGGVYGEGGEEALERVNSAIRNLENGTYRVEKWTTGYSGYDDGLYLTQVYWHCDGTQVTDYYKQERYSHSVTETAGGLFYGDWLKRSWENDDYDCMYFPEGCSVISDREIRFGQSLSRNSREPCTMYTYYFDEEGNIREILVTYSDRWSCRYLVTETTEEEIRDYIARKKAEV